jgi:hypothetical protein
MKEYLYFLAILIIHFSCSSADNSGLIPEGHLLENCDPQTAYELAQNTEFFPFSTILNNII